MGANRGNLMFANPKTVYWMHLKSGQRVTKPGTRPGNPGTIVIWPSISTFLEQLGGPACGKWKG